MLILRSDKNEDFNVVAGEWFEDGWVTPYVRFLIPDISPASQISFSFFKPENIDTPREVLFRINTQAVHKFVVAQSEEIITTSFVVPAVEDDEHNSYSISLSVNKFISPVNQGDQRELGLVLSEIKILDRRNIEVQT